MIALLMAAVIAQQVDATPDQRRALAEMVDTLRADPKSIQAVESLNLCNGMNARATALDEIATEKRYSKRVGVVSLSKLDSLKTDLRDAEELIAAARSNMKTAKVKPLSCSSKPVVLLNACVEQQPAAAEPCATDRMRAQVVIYRED